MKIADLAEANNLVRLTKTIKQFREEEYGPVLENKRDVSFNVAYNGDQVHCKLEVQLGDFLNLLDTIEQRSISRLKELGVEDASN